MENSPFATVTGILSIILGIIGIITGIYVIVGILGAVGLFAGLCCYGSSGKKIPAYVGIFLSIAAVAGRLSFSAYGIHCHRL